MTALMSSTVQSNIFFMVMVWVFLFYLKMTVVKISEILSDNIGVNYVL
jgi:hypothetical protein